jgi:hypothetical protein
MTDVIAGPCTGVKDKTCAGECPVDCTTKASGCFTSTPASAPTAAPASRCARTRRSSAKTTCPGVGPVHRREREVLRPAQLGSPGGAAKTGPLPDDTDHGASYVTSR